MKSKEKQKALSFDSIILPIENAVNRIFPLLFLFDSINMEACFSSASSADYGMAWDRQARVQSKLEGLYGPQSNASVWPVIKLNESR